MESVGACKRWYFYFPVIIAYNTVNYVPIRGMSS
jgi:hypothetical protein